MAEFSTKEMLEEWNRFDPILFKYYYEVYNNNHLENDEKKVSQIICESQKNFRKYTNIVEYEQSHQFSSLTKQKYADDYANLKLVYGNQDEMLDNINLMEVVQNKIIGQYINIDGMERLFSETYIEFEWEMHLSADYEKHNMQFYRDHFFHQIRDAYMMYILLRDYGFYERVRTILCNESESKVSRFVRRSLVQQRYYESADVKDLRRGCLQEEQTPDEKNLPENEDFYMHNMIYMAAFMAALFHDIGYPEVYYMTTGRHIRDYIASIYKLNAGTGSINEIYSLLQNSLLFRVESFENIERRIMNKKKSDHGALSAVIFLLHFYENGAIYRLSPYKIAAVELAALAIYNHTNKFGLQGAKKYGMYRPCFSLNPISYLLRICDDLQEWERIYFVISDRSGILFCNKCKTPIIKHREEQQGKRDKARWISRYRCNCQSCKGQTSQADNPEEESDTRSEADFENDFVVMSAFDRESSFPYRRIYNVSVCDSLEAIESEDKKKLCFKLHYDPYKLLNVTYLNATYAKYRIKELNDVKRLLECQKEIPQIFLDYFVTSNPLHIKIRLLEEYVGTLSGKLHCDKLEKSTAEDNPLGDKERFEQWLKECKSSILQKTEGIQKEFTDSISKQLFNDSLKCTYQDFIKRYLEMAMELYASLLAYQWANMSLNNNKDRFTSQGDKQLYVTFRDTLLVFEWRFVDQYSKSAELRCLIEDCFLQFTRMYRDITEFDYFPDAYYKQYKNGRREDIFKNEDCADADTKKYSQESEEYYYKALGCFMDADAYRPILMREQDVLKDKAVDAYTDLYLFYLMDKEIKGRL